MSSFVNTFSWSKSRHDNFQECPRRYYFQYYGSWGGWNAGAEARTREIYLLKQLKTRQMWKGDLVHRMIRSALEMFRAEGRVPAAPVLSERMVEQMRQEFRDSRSARYRTANKANALFEHEYGIPVPDVDWQRQRDEAVKCLTQFFKSETLRELARIGPKQLVEIDKDQPDQFIFEGIPVFVKLDLAYRRPDERWVIVDWKTGSGSADDLQAACYVMYLSHAYGAKVAETEVGESRLLSGSSHVYP
ncbi:MAG: PD-(D/E)XK nuclease family protein, partial [Acidobacteria bacterium]|nr:PD-(D/E)XK nuclease family protein [Acidobacteriota bacterium]